MQNSIPIPSVSQIKESHKYWTTVFNFFLTKEEIINKPTAKKYIAQLKLVTD